MKKFFYIPVLAIASLTLLWSCGETKELMEEIPASATFVAKFDLSQLAVNSGCAFDHDKIILNDDLNQIFERINAGSAVQLVADLAPHITADEVFAFGQTGESAWFITKTTAKDAAEKVLTEKVGQPSKKDSFTLFQSDDFGRFYLKDDLIWWQPSLAINESPAIIREAIDKSGNIGAIPGTGDFLRKDGEIMFAFSFDSQWYCSEINFDGPRMKSDLTRIDENGTVQKYDKLRKIDTGFLNFVPRNALAVAAVGLTPEFDWKSLAPAVGMIGGWQANLAFEFILPILKNIDGTVALALAMPEDSSFENFDDDSSFENMQFVLLAAMKEANAVATIDKVRSLLNQYFVPYKSESSTKLTVNFNGITATMAYEKGFLVLANCQPQIGGNDSGKFFSGKEFAAIANLSSDDLTALYGYPIPFGVDSFMSFDGEKMEQTLTLTGVESLFIPTLLKVIAND